jgi:hypothetical protein
VPSRKTKKRIWLIAALGTTLLCCGGGAVVVALAPATTSVSGAPTSHPTVSPTPNLTTSRTAPTTAASTRPATTSPPAAPSQAAYGLLQTIAWWDHAFRTVPPEQCATAGAPQPIGTEHAWQLPHGGIACVDQGPNAWHDHIINVDIYYPSPVSEQIAVTDGARLIPADAARSGTFDGVNADYSAKPNGSCRQVVFTSSTLHAVVPQLNPSWTGDPAKATIILYSGNATAENGAEQPYDQRRVHLASLSIDGENRSLDGIVHC